ncbi:MAG TPA: glycerol-3-phosphate acyltransferase [Chloroflexi bacterium]|nr:glycerol-3-phosphate acyltransferase [Chloroflexota bacterium]
MIRWVILLVPAYLIGAIPTGFLWARLLGRVDVREHGSGRTGATNVWRLAGTASGLLTAATDALKGALVVWLAKRLGYGPWETALAGTAAVLGHNYSVYLRFKGGAGTMISFGIAAMLWPKTLLILGGSGVLAMALFGHASVGSVLVAILLPLCFAVGGMWPYALGFGLPVAFLTLWALRPNIGRLLRGEERFLPIYRRRRPPICISRHPSKSP